MTLYNKYFSVICFENSINFVIENEETFTKSAIMLVNNNFCDIYKLPQNLGSRTYAYSHFTKSYKPQPLAVDEKGCHPSQCAENVTKKSISIRI